MVDSNTTWGACDKETNYIKLIYFKVSVSLVIKSLFSDLMKEIWSWFLMPSLILSEVLRTSCLAFEVSVLIVFQILSGKKDLSVFRKWNRGATQCKIDLERKDSSKFVKSFRAISKSNWMSCLRISLWNIWGNRKGRKKDSCKTVVFVWGLSQISMLIRLS